MVAECEKGGRQHGWGFGGEPHHLVVGAGSDHRQVEGPAWARQGHAKAQGEEDQVWLGEVAGGRFPWRSTFVAVREVRREAPLSATCVNCLVVCYLRKCSSIAETYNV